MMKDNRQKFGDDKNGVLQEGYRPLQPAPSQPPGTAFGQRGYRPVEPAPSSPPKPNPSSSGNLSRVPGGTAEQGANKKSS